MKLIFFAAIILLICAGGYMPADAQDSQVSTSVSGEEQSTVATPGEDESAAEEVSEGISRGVYWWADPDPVAIASLMNFGVDTVAFRIGKVTLGLSEGEEGATIIRWEEGGDFSKFAGLPDGLDYRPVLETEPEVWTGEGPSLLARFIMEEFIPDANLINEGVRSIEVKLPSGDNSAVSPGFPELEAFLAPTLPFESHERDIQIFLGFRPALISTISADELRILSGMIQGVVVYFTDYDYLGISPRITDRQWIDATSAELESLGMPFIAVLPVYNRALVYSSSAPGSPTVLPAIDIQKISESSEARQMGAAGTEYTVTSAVSIEGAVISAGDKVRVLRSLNEIDPAVVIEELPAMARSCKGIDLFRFPLVPGFDATPSEVFQAMGWISGGGTVAEETDPLEAEKTELDQKHNQVQQIIMFVTLGLMMFVLMRMFSKGAGDTKGGGGGGAAGK
jgi:hypothetical protein